MNAPAMQPQKVHRPGARSGLPTQSSKRFVWALIAVVGLAPLPFAGNRPFFWAMMAVVAAALCVTYLLMLSNAGRGVAFSSRSLRFIGILAAIFAAWHIGQMTMLGWLIGDFTVTTQTGQTIVTSTPSLSPPETWFSLLRFLSYAMMFFVGVQVAAKIRDLRPYLSALLFIIAGYAAYGLVALTYLGDTILFLDKWTYLGAATGPFVNRNSFATFLAFGSIIGVVLSLSSLQRERNGRLSQSLSDFPWVYAACTLLIFSVLLATQSRMGVFAALCGIAAVCLLWWSKARRSASGRSRWQTLGTIAVSLAVIGVLLVLAQGGGLLERLSSVDLSTGVRLELYRQIVAMIGERPLLGHGGGTFALAFPLFHQPSLDVGLVWDKAHSTYLELWSDHGLLMGSIPLLILGVIVARCIRRWNAAEADKQAEPLIAVGVAIVATLHSLVDFSLQMQANALLFTMLLAFGLSRESHRTEGGHQGREPTVINQPFASWGSPTGPSELAAPRERLQIKTMPSALYAIGDVHGCLDLLSGIEARIAADATDTDGAKIIVLLGDLIDRGPRSAQVIDYLLAPPPEGFRRICIAGNHEQMMMNFLRDPAAGRVWLDLGGRDTLASYGIDLATVDRLAKEPRSSRQVLENFIPRQHIEFVERLPVCVSLPGFLLVHGGLLPATPLERHRDIELMTVRLSEASFDAREGLTLVHGHTPLAQPFVSPSRIGLDTEAFSSGRLTAARLLANGNVKILQYSRVEMGAA